MSYVFVHLLPELAEGQQTVVEALNEGRGLAFLQSHIYLPEERESRFWAFALGAALYTAVLLAL